MSSRETMDDVGYSEELSLFGKTTVDDFGDGGQRKFYGKYRGTVMNNFDPEFRGRLLVRVPDVLGVFLSSWAMPCVPMSGLSAGQLSVPPVNAGVWVEFEQGNPRKPIWVGGFWGKTDAPALGKTITSVGPAGGTVLFQTVNANFLALADAGMMKLLPSGGIILSAGSSTIMIDKTGIKMIAPSVIINGATVTFNGGALMITA